MLCTSKLACCLSPKPITKAYALDHYYNSLDCRNSCARPSPTEQTAGDWAVWQNKSIHRLTQSVRPYSVRPYQSIASVPGAQDSE